MSLLKKPKAPETPPEVIEERKRQAVEIAKLSEDENRRLKRLLSASQGLRAFRGSALSRTAPGNKSGGAVASLLDVGGAGYSGNQATDYSGNGGQY